MSFGHTVVRGLVHLYESDMFDTTEIHCLSGGKDSFTLLAALVELRWRGLLPVDLLACNLDQGQPGWACRIASNTRIPI